MNEAVKLGLANGDVLQEITLSWLDLGCDKQVFEALESTIKVKLTGCTNADKARFLKQCALKLKGRTHEDTEVVQQVLQQVKDA